MGDFILLTRRRQAKKQTPNLEKILRGSVVVVKRYCGKSSCRCLKGHKHRALYVSRVHKGKPRLAYIPERSEKEARLLIKNYRKMKAVMEKISQLNLQRLTSPQGQTR